MDLASFAGDGPGQTVNQSSEGGHHVEVLLVGVLLSLVVNNLLSNAVNLGIDVSTPDIGQDPEFSLI